jgi:hypothetical protein
MSVSGLEFDLNGLTITIGKPTKVCIALHACTLVPAYRQMFASFRTYDCCSPYLLHPRVLCLLTSNLVFGIYPQRQPPVG